MIKLNKKKYFLTIVLCNLAISFAATSMAFSDDLASDSENTLDQPAQLITQEPLDPSMITIDQLSEFSIFDDRVYLEGYRQKYQDLPQNIVLEIIKDETLSAYKTAAAVRVFNEKFVDKVVSKQKKVTEKILLRRLNRSDSPFVQVELMTALLNLDRYRYFKSMVPALIQKLNHYNETVNEIAFNNLIDISNKGNNRPREARIVFNTLRKVLFLSRKRIGEMEEPTTRLSYKLKLLRWAIKILGTQELKKLPKEVLNLL
jgi:hypothetical protein